MVYLMIYFSASALLAVFYLRGKIHDIQTPAIAGLFIYLYCAASTLLNFTSNNFGAGDFIEIFRPLIYFSSLLFSFVILSPYIRASGFRECMDYMENLVFYSSFLEFLKYFEFSRPFFYLYTPFPHDHINYIRFSGFTGFAYAYAWILMICIIYHSIKKNGRVGIRFLYYSFLVLLTGSRTGIAALAFLYFLLFVILKRIRIRMLFLAAFISFSTFILYMLQVPVLVTSVDYTMRLVKAFMGDGGDGSLASRTLQANIALSRFYENPLYGMASNKSDNITIENLYFHHLGTWGIIGLVLYLLWIFLFGIYIVSRDKKRIFILMIAASFVLCFSSPIFDQVRLFNIFYAVIAALIVKENNRHIYHAPKNTFLPKEAF